MAADNNDARRLGEYLRHLRSGRDPAAFGLPPARRRTPGLRREEVAHLAHISPAWYTWLEQGRGGAASPEVLDRLARALRLDEVGREHLFLLGLGRAPEVRYRASDAVPPRLQNLLDAMPFSPAVVRTATWEVLAWNQAAARVMFDYGSLPPGRRNVLRLIFCETALRASRPGWQESARGAVAAFRVDVARAGAQAQAEPLVDELRRCSEEFDAIWRERDLQVADGSAKTLHHPVLGPITLEYSALAVNGRPDLCLVTYTAATAKVEQALRALMHAPAGVPRPTAEK